MTMQGLHDLIGIIASGQQAQIVGAGAIADHADIKGAQGIEDLLTGAGGMTA